MVTIFLLSWLAQSIAGRAAYNAQQLSQYSEPISWLGYLGSSVEPDPAELAVRIPGRRVDGDLRGLPAPARIARVQTGRQRAHHHQSGKLTRPTSPRWQTILPHLETRCRKPPSARCSGV